MVRKSNPIFIAYLLIIVAVFIFLVTPVRASGDCKGQSCNSGGGVSVEAGSNVTTKDSSRAFGVGGADYDIGQCRYHVGLLTAAWTHINEFCQGMELIRAGLVDAGVLHICKQTKIGKNYSDLQACRASLIVKQEPVVVVEEPESDEEDEAIHQAYAENLAELESRVARVESRRQTTTREVIQQPFLSDEKRAKLQAVLDE